MKITVNGISDYRKLLFVNR